MGKARILFYVGILVLFGMTVLHHSTFMESIDESWLGTIQRHPGPWQDTFSLLLSSLGSPVASLITVALFGWIYIRRRKVRGFLLFLLLLGVLTGFEIFSKLNIEHPRPHGAYVRPIQWHGVVGQLTGLSIPSDNSFPSGHCMRAVFLAGILALLCMGVVYRQGPGAQNALAGRVLRRRKIWLSILLGSYCLAVGWSRIYLGAHWPSDVLAGYVLGTMGVLMYIKAKEGWRDLSMAQSLAVFTVIFTLPLSACQTVTPTPDPASPPIISKGVADQMDYDKDEINQELHNSSRGGGGGWYRAR